MKHFFALLLSVLMVLSLLTACGDKTTPSDGDRHGREWRRHRQQY